MSKAIHSSVALLALATLLAPAATVAATNPQLNLGLDNVQLRAIDLTPGDGSAASYRISEQSSNYFNYVGYEPGGVEQQIVDQQAVNPGTPFDSTLHLGAYTSSIAGNGEFANVATSLDWDATASPFSRGTMQANYRYRARLTLSPGSALIFSGTLLQQLLPGTMTRANIARSTFSLSFTDESGSIAYGAHYMPQLRFDQYPDGWDRQDNFALTLMNSGSTATSYDMAMELDSGMWAFAPLPASAPVLSAVPEPASHAMLCLGAVVLAGAVRRQHRRRVA